MSIFRPGWDAFPDKLWDFYAEHHLNTLATVRPDGRPHVVPVGVTLDPVQQCAWVITSDGSRKVKSIRSAGDEGMLVAACQVDGGRWSTIEGRATVVTDQASIDRAVEMYAQRYRQPSVNPDRVAIRIEIDRIVHSRALLD